MYKKILFFAICMVENLSAAEYMNPGVLQTTGGLSSGLASLKTPEMKNSLESIKRTIANFDVGGFGHLLRSDPTLLRNHALSIFYQLIVLADKDIDDDRCRQMIDVFAMRYRGLIWNSSERDVLIEQLEKYVQGCQKGNDILACCNSLRELLNLTKIKQKPTTITALLGPAGNQEGTADYQNAASPARRPAQKKLVFEQTEPSVYVEPVKAATILVAQDVKPEIISESSSGQKEQAKTPNAPATPMSIKDGSQGKLRVNQEAEVFSKKEIMVGIGALAALYFGHIWWEEYKTEQEKAKKEKESSAQ